MKKLIDFAQDFYKFLGAEGVFAICIIFTFAVFLISLMKAIFKRGYGVKRKLNFLSFILGISLLELGVALLTNQGFGLCALTLGVGILLFTLLMCIRVKDKTRREQRAFARFIDEQINCKNLVKSKNRKAISNVYVDDENMVQEKEIISEPKTFETEVAPKPIDIDFTHVKNVLERLEFFTLSPSDRKQVKDLESAVITAERGEFSEAVKIRINDGLSALLKIMAKYGI